MALKEAFLRFREALRRTRRKEKEFADPVTKVHELAPILAPRVRQRRRTNNRRMTKARRAAYAGPGFVEIERGKRRRRQELRDQYFMAREKRRRAVEMFYSSPTPQMRQLAQRQYQDAEEKMKELVFRIGRV